MHGPVCNLAHGQNFCGVAGANIGVGTCGVAAGEHLRCRMEQHVFLLHFADLNLHIAFCRHEVADLILHIEFCILYFAACYFATSVCVLNLRCKRCVGTIELAMRRDFAASVCVLNLRCDA